MVWRFAAASSPLPPSLPPSVRAERARAREGVRIRASHPLLSLSLSFSLVRLVLEMAPFDWNHVRSRRATFAQPHTTMHATHHHEVRKELGRGERGRKGDEAAASTTTSGIGILLPCRAPLGRQIATRMHFATNACVKRSDACRPALMLSVKVTWSVSLPAVKIVFPMRGRAGHNLSPSLIPFLPG